MALVPPELTEQFFGPGGVVEAAPFGSGHINDTFLLRLADGREVVLQRINDHVFQDPAALMSNVERVCRHLAQKYAHLPQAHQRHLTLWPTRQGDPCGRDAQGHCWRAFTRVAPVVSFDRIEHPHHAYHVGKAFAEFQALLSDLPGPRLIETIPDFHHTPLRVERFFRALDADARGRARRAEPEVDFVRQHQGCARRLVEKLKAGILPERITHNDTKLNNLLFDPSGQQALCVVDLDTVMPGLVHYDFGDMIRTATNLGDEDERDLDRVVADTETFRQLARGYLEGGSSFLTAEEVKELVFSGILLTFEVGVRFLTDYLEGDHYFKIHRPDHNLERCRCQFALVRSLQQRQAEWEGIVNLLT